MTDQHPPEPTAADIEQVRALAEALTDTFNAHTEKFYDEHGQGMSFIVALMGVHNFHKLIVYDIEQRLGTAVPPQTIRNMALGTFSASLLNDPPLSDKEGA